MQFLPIFFSINDERCLVVGGGNVASRKVDLLRRAGGRIRVIAPVAVEELQKLAEAGDIELELRSVVDADVQDVRLVIAATDDEGTNRKVSELATARNIPVNVADSPELCNFILPSVLDRSPVLIAVSTGGSSPVLARQLRARLETLIPSAYGRLASLIDEYRPLVNQRLPEGRPRMRFWEKMLEGPMAEMVFSGQDGEARRHLEEAIERGDAQQDVGEVYLVGAGPGDPDLLTFRALRLMQQADVVVYDRLVAAPVLDMVRRDADRMFVGKERSKHAVPQERINEILVELARKGNRVLRLKGGDPFIFGRGGEEIETLAQEGVPFQVVPGITAASGCASYAGIPLTHRDYAQSCTFVTGHLKDGSLDLSWNQLVQPRQTVVFYMGLTGISVICEQLIAHGMAPDMPAALVEQGTTPNQRVLIGTVKSLPDIVSDSEVHAPTLTIIGQVINLHEKLKWYQPREHVPDSDFASVSEDQARRART